MEQHTDAGQRIDDVAPVREHLQDNSRIELETAERNERVGKNAISDDYEVMKRACLQLLTIPFLNDTWSDVIRTENPALPAEGFRTVGISPKGWQ